MPTFEYIMLKPIIFLMDILKVLYKEKTQLFHVDFQSIPLSCSGTKEYIHCWSNYTGEVKMLLWRLAPVRARLTASWKHTTCIYSKYVVLLAKQSRNTLSTNINKLMQLSYPTSPRASVCSLQSTLRVTTVAGGEAMQDVLKSLVYGHGFCFHY